MDPQTLDPQIRACNSRSEIGGPAGGLHLWESSRQPISDLEFHRIVHSGGLESGGLESGLPISDLELLSPVVRRNMKNPKRNVCLENY